MQIKHVAATTALMDVVARERVSWCVITVSKWRSNQTRLDLCGNVCNV